MTSVLRCRVEVKPDSLADQANAKSRSLLNSFLTDNPVIGPLLAQHCWARGNGLTHDQTQVSLTGESFNPRYLADDCNQTPEQAWATAQASMVAGGKRPLVTDTTTRLDAVIRIVHGTQVLADNAESDDAMCRQFETWVGANFASSAESSAA